MSGLLEGLSLDEKFRSQGRTIGEGDFSLLTNATWLTGELHCNAEHMKNTPFGERILPGPCILACVMGLTSTSGFDLALQSRSVRIVALLGLEDVRFTAPVLPGDTIWAETEVIDSRETRNPQHGVMKIRERGYKQTDEMVCEYVRAVLFDRSRA